VIRVKKGETLLPPVKGKRKRRAGGIQRPGSSADSQGVEGESKGWKRGKKNCGLAILDQRKEKERKGDTFCGEKRGEGGFQH